MSQRYVRIATFPENLYLDCSPVLISAGALLKDNKTGKVLAQLKFKNLSENIITAVKVSVIAYDISGIELTGVEEYQYLDISIKPTESFGDDKAIVLPDTNTRNCTVIIKEVVFASIAPWKNDNSTECNPIPSQVPLNEILNNSGLFEQYKRDTTDHSKYKPAKYLDLWLCSCGTPNKHHTKRCSNCKIELNRLLEATNLERLARSYKSYQEQQEKELKAKLEAQNRAGNIAIITTVIVLLLIAVVCVVSFVVIPNVKYKAADKMLRQGNYEEAISEFEALGKYKDSQERILEAIDAQQFAIEESIAASEAAEMARIEEENENVYLDAEKLLNSQNYDDAISFFESLGDYKDSSSKLMEAKYLKAESLRSSRKFAEAYLILKELGEYKDSSIQAKEIWPYCQYQVADIGDVITFASYEQDNDFSNGAEPIEWFVLNKTEEHLYIVSKYILDYQIYNDKDMPCIWQDTSLFHWLNNDWKNNAISSSEKNYVLSDIFLLNYYDVENMSIELKYELKVLEGIPTQYASSLCDEPEDAWWLACDPSEKREKGFTASAAASNIAWKYFAYLDEQLGVRPFFVISRTCPSGN